MAFHSTDEEFNRVTDELMDVHREAIDMLADSGNQIDCAMASIITTTSSMNSMSNAHGLMQVVSAINELNSTISLIAARMGVKLPSGGTIH